MKLFVSFAAIQKHFDLMQSLVAASTLVPLARTRVARGIKPELPLPSFYIVTDAAVASGDNIGGEGESPMSRLSSVVKSVAKGH
jgi:hypothetical protein